MAVAIFLAAEASTKGGIRGQYWGDTYDQFAPEQGKPGSGLV